MKRTIEGLVVVFLLAGTLAGCHKRDAAKPVGDTPTGQAGVVSPLGPGAGGQQPGAGDSAEEAAPQQVSSGPSIPKSTPAFFISLMKAFGILDLTRTGKVALARK